jgi:hypothetical protein
MEPTEEDIVRTPPPSSPTTQQQDEVIQQILGRIQAIVTEHVQAAVSHPPPQEANRYHTPVEIQVRGYDVEPHSVYFGDFQEAYLWVQGQVTQQNNENFDILPFLTAAQAMDTMWASGNLGFSVAFSETTSFRAFYRPE